MLTSIHMRYHKKPCYIPIQFNNNKYAKTFSVPTPNDQTHRNQLILYYNKKICGYIITMLSS